LDWPSAGNSSSAPDGTNVTAAPVTRHIDNAMAKAIARAFRWREMLENGVYSTIREIADAEKINESYVGRVLRLTLLAPDIVEAIVNGRQPVGLQLDGLMRRFPVEWLLQHGALGRYCGSRNANVLRTIHSDSLSGASRKIETSAHTIGNAPGPGIVDPDNDRTTILGIRHR
jgi:hypothetical protein